jgi:hypothetical protein
MPTITEATIRAFAHCPDVTCPGSAQEPVDGVRREVSETIGERGGDGPFVGVIEKSTLYTHFADPADAACSECGKTREISDRSARTTGRRSAVRTRCCGCGRSARTARPVTASGRGAGCEGPAGDGPRAARRGVRPRPVDEPEYQRKRAVLEGVVPESAQPRARAKKTVED